MIYICEGCRRRTELFYCRSVDEYLCEDCIDQLADEAVTEIEDGRRTDGPALLTSLFNR
jgi:uncharacterized protein YlaI